ncbi:hypothetical protein [Winogradskyella algicola]|uniref:hypothetical protein n=1 Tax=Winogradskyella algicola TaxID=2575815 RepID=UPI001107C216|nr:hypothetical protein [Winogradskyella algicola]
MISSLKIDNTDFTFKEVSLGKLFYNEKYMIAEFNEGVDLNFKNFNEVTTLIKLQFRDRPFGFISNRINSYSINLSDANKFNQKFPNVKAYAVVAHNPITEKVFEIEERFFKFNRRSFRDLNDAIDWVEKALSSLNK